MEWFIIFIVVALIVGVIKGAGEAEQKKKVENEAKERKERAEKAREAIMASGDKEMINKLLLMDAAYQENSARSQALAGTNSGSSALGTAAAVAGGVIVADAVTTSMHQAALEDALAEVQADFEANAEELQASLDGLSDLGETDDFDLEL